MPAGRPPRVGGDHNPVTRELLREKLADEHWRTTYDMAVTLQAHIPVEVASRTILDSPRILKLERDAQIMAGRRRLIQKTLVAGVAEGIFESRKGPEGATEYRIKPLDEVSVTVPIGTNLPGGIFTRPAKAKGGITLPMVFHLVRAHPDSDCAELIARLSSCFQPDEIVVMFSRERVRQVLAKDKGLKITGVEGRIKVEQESDPADFLRRAKEWRVQSLLNSLVTSKHLSVRRTYRVVPDREGAAE